MKIINSASSRLFILVACLLSTTASAALLSRLGGQALYDTDLNITWLTDANLVTSNTFGLNVFSNGGAMRWDTAQSWIVGMNSSNYLGFNDWRLPTMILPDASCSGFGCTDSEMGYLFYNELGGPANHNSNYDLFSNIQTNNIEYWSGTEWAASTSSAWEFNFTDGMQNYRHKKFYFYAMVVRNGDVASVPLPTTLLLLCSGLIGLLGLATRSI